MFTGRMTEIRLNPLSTGKSVQTDPMIAAVTRTEVLIPYLQGSLFRQLTLLNLLLKFGLNPLSTGKSVQTKNAIPNSLRGFVLIPYLQGSLFRRTIWTIR